VTFITISLSDQLFYCFVEDLVVYKDVSILYALYVCIWYVLNKLSSLNKDFIIIIIIIIIQQQCLYISLQISL